MHSAATSGHQDNKLSTRPLPQSSADNHAVAPKVPSKRVRQACLRCHKQKLKCDNERPCALCVRSNIECKENLARSGRRRKYGLGSISSSTGGQVNFNLSQNSKSVYDSPNSGDGGSDSGLPSLTSSSVNEVPYQERPSTYHLVNNIFESYSPSSGVRSGAEAIPDGSPKLRASSLMNDGRVSVFSLIGIDLPCQAIVNLLLDNYLKSVHFFITVIHEPTFRSELDMIVSSGSIQQSRLSFLVLVLVVLAFGSSYTSEDAARKLSPGYERESLKKMLIKTAERHFLDIFDHLDIEAVQAGLILSTYYSYFGQPRRGYVAFGATLTAAKAMCLQREALWGDIDPLTREIRRRAWWAVYAGDGFAALNFGRPSAIDEADWEVKMVRNIDDNSITCPGFQSMEILEDGSRERVTILTYQRCKYKLYQISSTILKTIYFHKGATIQETTKKMKAINERLIAWERSVPPELKLRSFPPNITSKELEDNRILKTFQLQALALTLFYNNVQLLLHRPLLTCKGFSQAPRPNARPPSLSANANQSSDPDVESYKTSKTQCFTSAMRTSRIGEYQNLLLAARNTPVAPYLGIQTFTAGAVLGLFALSMPFTDIAQDAKLALGRLIKMPQILGYHDLLSDQCANILKELVHLVLSEEMRALTAESMRGLAEPLRDRPTSLPMSISTSQSCGLPRSLPPVPENSWPATEVDAQPSSNFADAQGRSMINPDFGVPISNENNFMEGNETVGFHKSPPSADPEVLNNAVMSLQNVFRDERARTGVFSWRDSSPYTIDEGSMMTPFVASLPTTAASFNAEFIFDDTGQTWIWDHDFNFE